MPRDVMIVEGAGGGASKSKGGSSSQGSGGSDPNTLFSTATIKMLDLLCEGEIAGIRGGQQGILFNGTPCQNEDLSFNFNGVAFDLRNGLPDQPAMEGFPEVRKPLVLNEEVKHALPKVQQIDDPTFNTVNITLMVPALFFTDPNRQNRTGANTVIAGIEIRHRNGPWIKVVDSVISGKCISPYYRDHYVPLPMRNDGTPSHPWQIRVTKNTTDSTDETIDQRSLVFYGVTGLTDGKFSYPNSALVGITANAKLFNAQMPSRAYIVNGLLINVPSNYDPVNRTYAGIWDGTFKMSWSNNPAWVLNELLINDRFGIGEFVDQGMIDKFALYEIARYCDQPVLDGYGGTSPRFTFNCAITEAREAYAVLQMVAQAFRGMVYWSAGSVTATQNCPKDPVIVVTPANVLNGKFNYSSSSRKARHTVAMVTWNDPENQFRQAIEVVQDDDGIFRYGYNPTKVEAIGCTNRGQAYRYGLWTLLTEQKETQIVNYRAGLDHSFIRPGDVVVIQDPNIADINYGGRLGANNTLNQLQLDRAVDLSLVPGPYTMNVITPDGKLHERVMRSSNLGPNGEVFVQLAQPLPDIPLPNAMWLISTPSVVPQQFIVIGFKEVQPHIFEINALQYEPGKFGAVDFGKEFEALATSNFPNTVPTPTNLNARGNEYLENGLARQGILFSWTPGDPPFNSISYRVTVIRPDGSIENMPLVETQSVNIRDAEPGKYKLFVTAIGINGKSSRSAQLDYEYGGWEAHPGAVVTKLKVKGGATVFTGRSCTVVWTNVLPDDVPPYPVQNVVYVNAMDGTLLHRELLAVGQNEFTYGYDVNVNEGGPRRRFRISVSALSIAGPEGGAISLNVSNPAPEKVNPFISTGAELIFIRYKLPADNDFMGTLIWIEKNPDFDPFNTTPVYDGTGTSFSMKAEPETDYYVQLGAYDAFGIDEINLTSKYKINPKANLRLTFDDLGELLRIKVERNPEIRDLQYITQETLERITQTDGRATATYEELYRIQANDRQAALEFVSSLRADLSDETINRKAGVEEVRQTIASYDGSFSAYRTTVEASFGSLVSGMSGYESRIAYTESRVTEISNAAANDKEAVAIFQRDLTALFGQNEARIKTNETAVSDIKSAQVGINTRIDAAFNDVNGLVNNEANERRAAVDQAMNAIASYDSALADYKVNVNAKLGNIDSSISIQASSIARANEAVATLQQSVEASYGSVTAGGIFRVVARPAAYDAIARASIEVRAQNHDNPSEGWVEAGTYWEIYQDPPGSNNLRGRIANKASQFYVIDTGSDVMSVPLRVENGTVYIDKLVVRTQNVAPGTFVRGASGRNQNGASISRTITMKAGGSALVFVTYGSVNIFAYNGGETFKYILKLRDTGLNFTVQEFTIGYARRVDNGIHYLSYMPVTHQITVTSSIDRQMTLEASLVRSDTKTSDGQIVDIGISMLALYS
jgi:hypothetical protein